MSVVYDKILGRVRDGTSGFSGNLLDSTNTSIAVVQDGLIKSVVFTGSFDLFLHQNGVDNLLLQNGTDRIGLQ